ncbi:MAG TPA: hypothetical protein VM182_05380 [Terriglobia bacterium]|nr:hypothetical protein [Terriglobia bacterium]
MAIPQPPSRSTHEFDHRRVVWTCLLVLGVLILPAMIHAGEGGARARLTFTKVLKGSTPEYLMISVDSAGEGTYEGRRLTDPSNPRRMRLSPATTRRLFALCELLNFFENVKLESGKKVANLGQKTLVYERDGRQNRVEFNYTQRREGEKLVDLFEKIAIVQEHIETLEYAIKYDHLSLPGELRQIQIDMEKKALADPELMVPSLEKIVRNRRFLNLAQSRAQDILQRIQASN